MIQLYGEDDLSDEALDLVQSTSETLGCQSVMIETFNGSARIRFEMNQFPDSEGFVNNIQDPEEWREMLESVIMSCIDWMYETKEEHDDYREETFTA